MHQMYAYSKKYGMSEIWLLYLVNNAMRNYEQIVFDSGDGATVSLFFTDVAHIEDSLSALYERLQKN